MPTTFEINATVTVHIAPGATLPPQSFVCKKGPVVEVFVMDKAVAPVLVNVTL